MFNNSGSTCQEIIKTGEILIIALYTEIKDSTETLNPLRFQLFAKSVTIIKVHIIKLQLTQESKQQELFSSMLL